MQTLRSDSRPWLPGGGCGKRQDEEDTERLKESSVDVHILTMCGDVSQAYVCQKSSNCKF